MRAEYSQTAKRLPIHASAGDRMSSFSRILIAQMHAGARRALRFLAALLLGVPIMAQAATLVRTSAFDYSSTTGLLTKEIVEPGNSNLCLEPALLFVAQGPQKELTPGVNLKYLAVEGSRYTGRKKASAFSVGAYYRAKDAFILSTMFEYSNYAAGFSYDLNTSTLKAASHARGGMEVFLRFVFPNPFGGQTSQSMI